jgi:rod shape-determining protein MreC
MKKNFKIKLLIAAFIILFIALFSFLNFQGFFSGPKNFVAGIFSPVQRGLYVSGGRVSNYFGSIFSLNQIISQNQQLKDENSKLQADLSKSYETERENELLRQQLNLARSGRLNLVLANIIGMDPVNFGENALIDKGSETGIKADMPAVTASGVLVGRVSEAGQTTSKIQLLTDPNSAINIISQKTRSTGILKSNQGKEIIMEMIPQESNIEVGEQIITSGLGGGLPKGILVGEIESIISNDVEAFKKAKVKPAMDINNLESVFVIILGQPQD